MFPPARLTVRYERKLPILYASRTNTDKLAQLPSPL